MAQSRRCSSLSWNGILLWMSTGCRNAQQPIHRPLSAQSDQAHWICSSTWQQEMETGSGTMACWVNIKTASAPISADQPTSLRFVSWYMSRCQTFALDRWRHERSHRLTRRYYPLLFRGSSSGLWEPSTTIPLVFIILSQQFQQHSKL